MQKKITLNLVIVALLMMFSASAFAQFPNHVKGDLILKGSVGLPFTNGKTFEKVDGQTFENSGLSMYFQGSFDYAISNKFDIGLFGGMGSQVTDNFVGDNKFTTITSSYVGGGARLVYHVWGKARWKWDPYALIGVGMMSETLEVDGQDNDIFGEPETTIAYTARIGVNYYFTPTFGLHAEGGYGISYGTLGMQLRF